MQPSFSALGQNFTPHLRHVVPKPAQAYEAKVPVKVREWIAPALATPGFVLLDLLVTSELDTSVTDAVGNA